MNTLDLQVRALAARDSLDLLTALLHRAYAPLAAQGLNFTAATQTAEVTRQRAAEGQCFVVECGRELVGTVTVCGPYDVDTAPWMADVPWFRDPDTAHFHQFAVDPAWQGRGVGQLLLESCERWARRQGYQRMALDTALPATTLRALYEHLGYADAGQVQWPGKAYRSVVMQKALKHSLLREQLRCSARYNVWATQRLLSAVDALPEADYRRDVGLAFKSVHGTLNHLLVAEHRLWFRRFAEDASPVLALDAEVEPDRARLRDHLLSGARSWLPLLEGWTVQRLAGTLSYRRMTGEAVTLPFAPTLMHVFNHGTHHRGQITAALTALGRPAPGLDMVTMLQEEAPA